MEESKTQMKEEAITRFWKWVEQLKRKAGGGPYSWRQLESLGGVANGTLSRRVKSNLPATVENCEAIATALHIPLRDCLIQAGLIDIPHTVDEIQDADLKTALSIMRDLGPSRRRQVIEYAEYLLLKDSEAESASQDE